MDGFAAANNHEVLARLNVKSEGRVAQIIAGQIK